ncbi:MAG: signal recognition particle-docking protein FtsY [Alphaproteobacteria bacterium]|nr:signal recognition particle-docking protein FtsY [Alphaproteobacteria bacterium]
MSESSRPGWIARLTGGLQRTSSRLTESIGAVLTRRRLDEGTLQAIEEALIAADIGLATAAKLIEPLRKSRHDRETTEEDVRALLADGIRAILAPVAHPLVIDRARCPHVVLVIGVNGSGKTTTIGKLAHRYRVEGLKVVLAAGDTFRAAAIDQLKLWGERAGASVVSGAAGADAAGLAYSALEQAKAAGADVLLIDTAGRLHNKAHLMDELAKLTRVLKKLDAGAPHDTLLVLDATTGQNAHAQVETFKSLAGITGLIVTKLDGSAKGGVIVALAERFGLPIHAIGVGESAEDLDAFDPDAFAKGLLGLSG